MEICAARVCREGGGRVKKNQFLRDLNLEIHPSDGRRIEVIANGLPLWGGKQIALDTTIISALTGKGIARGREAGHALKEAAKKKQDTYAEVVESRRCHLLVMGFEVAGRWSEEGVAFVRSLAKAKAESSPKLLRKSAQILYFQRWTGLLACAVQNAFAASLLGESPMNTGPLNGDPVSLADLDRPT